MEKVEEKNGENHPYSAQHVKDCKPAEKAVGGRLGSGDLPECPKFIPQKVINHCQFCCTDLAYRDVESERSRVGQHVQDSHVHEKPAATYHAEFDEFEEAFRAAERGKIAEGVRGGRPILNRLLSLLARGTIQQLSDSVHWLHWAEAWLKHKLNATTKLEFDLAESEAWGRDA